MKNKKKSFNFLKNYKNKEDLFRINPQRSTL